MVDQNISDLFFNTDLSECGDHDARGQFTGWDVAKLQDAAEMFLNCLQRLGVPVPSANELIADFRARV